MKDTLHIVMIPFRGVGIDLRNDAWFAERVRIFKEFTLQSLAKQTNRDFVLWLSFRPQDEYNMLVYKLEIYLDSQGFKYVFTFDGLMYHDDKFSTGLFKKAKNIARVIRGCYRAGNFNDLFPSIAEIAKDKNETLLQRLDTSLCKLWDATRAIRDNLTPNHILLTRIDSDDMFRHNAVAMIQEHFRQAQVFSGIGFEALVCSGGYIYNSTTKELAEWNPTTNPPFHTLIFKGDTFFYAERHLAFYRGFQSHEDIPKLFKSITLPDGMYCVTVNDPKVHISTAWRHHFRGNGIIDNKEDILGSFL